MNNYQLSSELFIVLLNSLIFKQNDFIKTSDIISYNLYQRNNSKIKYLKVLCKDVATYLHRKLSTASLSSWNKFLKKVKNWWIVK